MDTARDINTERLRNIRRATCVFRVLTNASSKSQRICLFQFNSDFSVNRGRIKSLSVKKSNSVNRLSKITREMVVI